MFSKRGFLSQEECAAVREAFRGSSREAAPVFGGERTEHHPETRRVAAVEAPAHAMALVRQRLAAVMPQLGRFHGLELSGCQEPQFLSYQPGDFYKPHVDGRPSEEYPERFRLRRVSAVLFLTDESQDGADETHAGGWLTLYGVLDDPERRDWGFPVRARAGTLVAFRSDVLHEVQPVTAGERMTIVTWFT